jgi:hypothetical protein
MQSGKIKKSTLLPVSRSLMLPVTYQHLCGIFTCTQRTI